ncbi:hypothetical protein LTS15_004523 [Exophiala xenobiotica]|nr:hypothetical protein LTS15_004523 [Exophiala xenobiotica]
MRAATSYSQTDLDFRQPTTKAPEQVSHIVDHPAPLLAPPPLSRNANDRLGPELQEKPRIPPIREFIHSPLLAVKEVIENEGGEDFAQNVGKAEVSHGANVALVLENARVRQSNEEDGASRDEDVLDGLKQSRQDSFTRWTIDRHVRNVARIQPHVIPLRARRAFLQRNAQGRERIDWIGYGQHVSSRDVHPVTEVADIHTVVAVHRRKLFTSNDRSWR